MSDRSTPANASGSYRPEYMTIEAAAALLSTTDGALRARCRRTARREGREVVARLGGGVIAFKFGRSWRVRFAA